MSAESTAVILRGLDLAHWTITDLWVASAGMGGSFTRADIEHIADGTADATPLQHDILAAALNDHLDDLGQQHPVNYWRDLPSPR